MLSGDFLAQIPRQTVTRGLPIGRSSAGGIDVIPQDHAVEMGPKLLLTQPFDRR